MPGARISDLYPIVGPQGFGLDWLEAFTVLARRGDEVFDFMAGRCEEQRRQLERALAPLAVTWLSLEHGAQVADIGDPLQAASPVADGALVTVPGTAAAFTTADCLPVIVASSTLKVAAAIHAGWRSLAGGIIEAAVARMQAELGVNPRELKAWIGPAIAAADYEVSSEVRTALLARPAITQRFFKPTSAGHWLADLPAAANAVLASLGVLPGNIERCPLCTFADPRLHSARRDGPTSGRMATIVGIRLQ
jgi:YfiH family protein